MEEILKKEIEILKQEIIDLKTFASENKIQQIKFPLDETSKSILYEILDKRYTKL